MSLWSDILNHAAHGDSEAAYRVLNFELPLALRWPESTARGEWRYKGPVAKVVRMYIATMPDSERGMLSSREEDFVDYITDLIVASVRRSLALVEFCRTFHESSVEQIAERFTGWDGLKRNLAEKSLWVTRHLQSMVEAGVPLPESIKEAARAAERGKEPLYGYDELALASEWKPELSWKDFKSQQEIDGSYLCITDPDAEEDAGVGDEAFDYGAITVAQVVLNLEAPTGGELTVDLNKMGQELTGRLRELLEQLHLAKPADGYNPIAWHNIWWNVVSRYEALPLQLELREPLCDVDRELAAHIAKTYKDVSRPSRLNIFRRRTKLHDQCIERAQALLTKWSLSNSY